MTERTSARFRAGPSVSFATKDVPRRRELHFNTLDDVVADAERLVASRTTRVIGNWPLDRLLTHLALVINRSIDGMSSMRPWHRRLFGLFAKPWILKYGMPAGIKLSKDREAAAYPQANSLEDALAILKNAVERMRHEQASAVNPLCGKLTHEEWTQFHLRHAELHLSFALAK
jgi:hypothetical protein